MSEAYLIKKFYHVTETKHRRLRQEKLIPLIDKLAAHHIMNTDIDELLSTEEAMKLRMDDIDTLEDELHIMQNLLEGDWLIDYKSTEHPIYLMKFKKYSYQPHKHLFIKHFGEVSHIFEVKVADLPSDIMLSLYNAAHLATLPLSVSRMLDKYEVLALALEQEAEKAKQEPDEPKPATGLKRGRPSRNGPVIVKKAANSHGLPANNAPSFVRSEYTGHSIAKLQKKKFE